MSTITVAVKYYALLIGRSVTYARICLDEMVKTGAATKVMVRKKRGTGTFRSNMIEAEYAIPEPTPTPKILDESTFVGMGFGYPLPDDAPPTTKENK